MPKQKIHKGLRKRTKVTAKGKVMRKKTYGGHLMSGKSGKRRRKIRQSVPMFGPEAKRALEALGEN